MNTATTGASSIADWLDLERYPLKDIESGPGRALLERSRAQFQDQGAVCLPGFVRAALLPGLCAQFAALAAQTFYNVQQHNVRFDAPDPAFTADHPSQRLLRTAQKALAADMIDPSTPLFQIYQWEPLRRFLAGIIDHDAALQTHADALAALNVMTMDDGDELGWHFDRSDFATTLMLQAPQSGGRYQFVPHLRSDRDPAWLAVGQVLDGRHAGVRELDIQPGTLTFFAGRFSPHRVTPVRGGQRIVAVLGYGRERGKVFSAEERRRFYGRAESMS